MVFCMALSDREHNLVHHVVHPIHPRVKMLQKPIARCFDGPNKTFSGCVSWRWILSRGEEAARQILRVLCTTFAYNKITEDVYGKHDWQHHRVCGPKLLCTWRTQNLTSCSIVKRDLSLFKRALSNWVLRSGDNPMSIAFPHLHRQLSYQVRWREPWQPS